MNHSKCVLLITLVPSILVITAAPHLRAASSDWGVLQNLKPGQQIGIVLDGDKSYEGAFQALNNEGITLRQVAGDQTFAHNDVLRVYCKSKNNCLRNVAIGAGIGAALAALGVKANSRTWFENTGVRNIGWVWPASIGTFAAFGAAMPTGGWHEVYRAHRHR